MATYLVLLFSLDEATHGNDLILWRTHGGLAAPNQTQRVLRRAEGSHLARSVTRIQNKQRQTRCSLLNADNGAGVTFGICQLLNQSQI